MCLGHTIVLPPRGSGGGAGGGGGLELCSAQKISHIDIGRPSADPLALDSLDSIGGHTSSSGTTRWAGVEIGWGALKYGTSRDAHASHQRLLTQGGVLGGTRRAVPRMVAAWMGWIYQ